MKCLKTFDINSVSGVIWGGNGGGGVKRAWGIKNGRQKIGFTACARSEFHGIRLKNGGANRGLIIIGGYTGVITPPI